MSEPSHSTTPPVAQRMQELLSRAVEEQVGEQRHLAEALAELRALVSRLPAEVGEAAAATSANVTGALAELREDLARTSAQVDGTSARVDALSGRLDGLDDLAGRLPEDGAIDPDQAAAAARSAVAPLVERLSALEESLAGRLAGLDLALPAERAALLGELAPRIDSVANSALTRADVDSAVTPVSGAVAEAIDRLAGVSETLESRLDALETGLEKRLTEVAAGLSSHIDEAVLALAAALLRNPASSPVPSTADIEAAVSDSAAARSAADDEGLGAAPEPSAEQERVPQPASRVVDGYGSEGLEAPARRRSWWKHVE